MEEGIYFGLPEDDYFAADGLSCSGMKKLAVSPLNYWHHNLNPEFSGRKETAALRFGKAAHCLGLEPARFDERYALELTAEDRPGALVTVDDMKLFLEKNGLPKTGKKKQDLVDRIKASGLPAVIWDEEVLAHAELHEGKVLLGCDESAAIRKAAAVLAADPYAKAALTGGLPEVSFFVRHPETNVLLKARMDYVKPSATIDLKTFSNGRGKPTDKVIFDAIFYENYHLQYVVYATVREIARQKLAAGEITTYGEVSEAWLRAFVESENHGFGFVFIESSEPFDLRIVELRQAEARDAGSNVYWHTGTIQMRDMMELYAECGTKFGEQPWREPHPPHMLNDTDIPQLMFA